MIDKNKATDKRIYLQALGNRTFLVFSWRYDNCLHYESINIDSIVSVNIDSSEERFRLDWFDISRVPSNSFQVFFDSNIYSNISFVNHAVIEEKNDTARTLCRLILGVDIS
ncbi:MAG: hypothetical protein F6K40_12420 [Okeania sp. SIO3I5]|uniref:hypothetical protein n=1 Tax=Okeania sp. SIO3I5 TaxID=2607805 RepID=UPI0013B7C3FD|nr:hypothetical protein [Okeania sp. SIO3I5]NEQ37034.1 hypothetical protein [Okeania sp. SIO3I5]